MDSLISLVDETLSEIIGWLPNSPFTSYMGAVTDPNVISVLKWFNLFIGVPNIIVTFELWLVAVAGYYIISSILRSIKAVQ